MPILKVSENLYKEAMEVIRINITVLGDCPQCQGHNYRSGVCEDCAFISPEVLEAIKEWQQSQGIDQKAAAARFSFLDAMPTSVMDTKCPNCGKLGFDLECECGHRDLDTLKSKGLELVIDGTGVKDMKVRRRFLSPYSVQKDKRKHKKKHKKSSSRLWELQELLESKQAKTPGARLQDDLVASDSPVTRMNNMLQTDAQLKDQQSAQNPSSDEQPEEQK